MYPEARYRIVGDRGITVEFGNEVNEKVNHQTRRMSAALERSNLPGVIEFFPTLRSLFVLYDPLKIKTRDLIRELRILEDHMADIPPPPSRIFEIPVVYGEEYRDDLENIASFLELSPQEVIHIHCRPQYLVLMNGALGGTAFIKMPAALAFLPRKKTPVLSMPAGVVMLAGGLGCLFKAMDGPSGWNVIGKSPLKQWFPEKDPPLLILAGDRVQYKPIDERDYREIKKMVEEGIYRTKMLESRES
jgi:inhibitor of KinA